MTEEWRPIERFNGYEVSNAGNVRSFRMTGNLCRIGKISRPAKSRLEPSGRVTVRLRTWEEPRKTLSISVARLVLSAFIGPCPSGMEACHNNGNPYDNRVENLRWDTHAANMEDMKRHGTYPRGSRNTSSKLTEENVIEIITSDTPSADLARKFKVDPSTISKIRYGVKWKWFSV